MRRILTVAIVASWLVLVALLVRKQGAPPALDVTTLPRTAPTGREEWFGVYHGGGKIGHAHRVGAQTPEGYRFDEESAVTVVMLGVPQALRTTLVAETDRELALRRFDFTLVSPAAVFAARGTSDGQRLAVRYGPPGQEATLELPLAEPIYLPSTLRPHVLAGDPAPGTRYTVPVFSPLTLRNEPLTLTVEGRESLTSAAGPVETILLVEEHQGIRTRAWLDRSGAVLREEAALGFTLERETREQALAGARASVDLVTTSRIPTRGRIPHPRQAAYLVLRVSGGAATTIPADPPRQRREGSRLRIARETLPPRAPALPDGAPAQLPLDGTAHPRAEDSPARPSPDGSPLHLPPGGTPAHLPVGGGPGHPPTAGSPAHLPPGGAPPSADDLRAYRAPAPFIEADDPTVVAQARAIVGGITDATVAARRLVAWVHETLEKAPTVTVPSARQVLRTRRGDCNEHAVLLTALARAAGIPARVVAGAVHAGDGFYYHAWTELWLDGWVSADGVFGQMPADATHVKLVEGGPERHLALAGAIGALAFAVEEVR